MSNRLTNEWTKTPSEAFGASGAKGEEGEEFLMRVFELWGWDFKHYPDDYNKQIKGIDIEFKKPDWHNYYSCDVKNNLWNDGRFRVYENWLFKVECDRIFHVNPQTGWLLWYGVKEMREAYVDNGEGFMEINARFKEHPFIKMSKYEYTI